jgi:hypothetical protein
VVRGSNGGFASAWWSIWASPEAATAFSDAMTKECARHKPKLRVHRHEERVLVTHGADQVDKLQGELASLSIVEKEPRPIAELTIPERTPIPERRKGRIRGSQYQSIWLGLNAPIPPGTNAEVGEDQLELAVSDGSGAARGVLALYDHVPRGHSLAQLFGDVVKATREASGLEPHDMGNFRYRGPLGDVIMQRYLVGSIYLEVHVLPVCAETGALVWLTIANHGAASTWLQHWRESFRWIADRRIPACRWLDPK